MRVALPDRPGSLGQVASALGTVEADIHAIEVVDREDGYVVDDFMLSAPSTTLADSLVTACTALEGVDVMWLSHYPEQWGLQSDVDVLNMMTADPKKAERILMESAPAVFRVTWALIVDRTLPEVIAHTALAPELKGEQVATLGNLTEARSADLPSDWLDGWGETSICVAPLHDNLSIVVGRKGGPEFRASEVSRLRLLAGLAHG